MAPNFALEAAFGFSSVAFGAMGRHLLAPRMNADQQRAFGNGVLYHLLHTVAMMVVQVAAHQAKVEGNAKCAARLGSVRYLFAGGVACFSGSIYALCLGGPRVLGPVTPLGGLLMLGGWMTLLVEGLRR